MKAKNTVASPSDSIDKLSKLSSQQRDGLVRLGIVNIKDLLVYAPVRYVDLYEVTHSLNLTVNEAVTLYGALEKVTVRRSFRGHIPMTEAKLVDGTGAIRCVWFNQAYIGKLYPEGSVVKVSGIVKEDTKGYVLTNPQIERVDTIPDIGPTLFSSSVETPHESGDNFLTPVYRETKGVSSLFLLHLVKRAVASGLHALVEDPLPVHIRHDLALPSLQEAILYLHFPKSRDHAVAARKRFSFEQIFVMKLYHEKEKALLSTSASYAINQTAYKDFVARAPFAPTKAQMSAITTMMNDMLGDTPMNRLLEGDVGSGKTFVAATATYAVTSTMSSTSSIPLQVAYMAPTEILATQHFESFCQMFAHTGRSIGLMSRKGCKVFPSKSNNKEATSISKRQLSTWLEDGRVSIVIGTHALIQESVKFRHLALVIVDEQHRFGVKQRKRLLEKRSKDSDTPIPHLLSMSATPIPRTLALTLFGDLELSVLDELPKGRKPIHTEVIRGEKQRKEAYEKVRAELHSGRQAYVICPRIETTNDDEVATVKTVHDEAHALAETIFPEWIVDMLHGKMKGDDKEEVMNDFVDMKSHILVATSVVEVGVNVPNATVIIIEHAEMFGLAQLHQLRGRVGRSEHQSYCFLFARTDREEASARLNLLSKETSGFALAEEDMKKRGIGALIHGKQWGVSDIAMEALKNPKLVEYAQKYAKDLIMNDPELTKHPVLAHLLTQEEKVHME